MYAQRIFKHYFKLSAAGGWNWDSDNAWEIETALDDIIETAIKHAADKYDQQIVELEKRIDALEQLLSN